jgi:hypothetical protein
MVQLWGVGSGRDPFTAYAGILLKQERGNTHTRRPVNKVVPALN